MPYNPFIWHTANAAKNVRIIFLVGLLQVTYCASAQKKYYEFNNPDAITLDRKKRQILLAHDWQGVDLQVQVRDNNYSYKNRRTVRYHPDGKYTANDLTGYWSVKYNRYLVHESKEKNTHPNITGIYSIALLNDSVLVLSKLHSSTRDMRTTLTFKKNVEGYNKLTKVKIFTDQEPINYTVHAKRFTLPVDMIATVDSLALAFITEQSINRPSPITSLEPFYRQYIGFDDEHGNKVIYLNAFCDYRAQWEEYIIHKEPANTCGFRIYVNISKKECFGFHTND